MSTAPDGRDSIRQSLARAIFLTLTIALVTSSVASLALEVLRYRQTAEESVRAFGDLIGVYSQPALDFDDPAAGREALAALRSEKTILAAAIYDATGELFASYQRAGSSTRAPVMAGASGAVFDGDRLDLFTPIVSGGHAVGHVYIQKQLTGLTSALRQDVATMVAVMVIALLMAGAVSSRLREQIARPLDELGRSAAAMERGDLSIAAVVDRGDELGRLADAFNRTRGGLRKLVSQVRNHALAISDDARILFEESESLFEQARRQEDAVGETGASIERVGASARDVRDTVDGLASTANETSSSVTELGATARRIDEHMDTLFETVDGSASSISQMGAAIRQIAHNADGVGAATASTTSSVQVLRETVKTVESNAKQCETLSAKATENAQHGSDVVGKSIRGMEQIHASFQGLERIVSNLSERSEAIDEVVKVIEAVVAETNLLALNASIISSHAGEHGRAFAVVAQEVKNLADRTAGSTREIAEAMEAVRSGIHDAVSAVGDGSEIVSRGVAFSEEAGRALAQIQESAEQSTSKVGEIVRATEAQSSDIDAVDRAMNTLEGGVEQITVGTHEQDKVASELLSGVEQLRQLAHEVKVATSEQSRQSSHMARAVGDLATGVGQILVSAENQNDDVEAILETLKVFRENTVESTRRAEALRQCVESLSGRAEQLGAGVGRFTV